MTTHSDDLEPCPWCNEFPQIVESTNPDYKPPEGEWSVSFDAPQGVRIECVNRMCPIRPHTATALRGNIHMFKWNWNHRPRKDVDVTSIRSEWLDKATHIFESGNAQFGTLSDWPLIKLWIGYTIDHLHSNGYLGDAEVDLNALVQDVAKCAANVDDGSGPPAWAIEWTIIHLKLRGMIKASPGSGG